MAASAGVGEPRAPALDRAMMRIGVHDDVARIIGATPALRASWLMAALAVALFAVLGAAVDSRILTGVAILAPILPVAGVAAAYGAWADPMFEISQATPSSGFHVLVLRSLAVLASAAVLVCVTAAVTPTTGLDAIAWLLPSLAVCATSLMLATFMPIARAAAIVALGWLALAAALAATQPAFALFRGQAQLIFFAVTIVSSAVLARRRQHLEMANLHTKRALVDAADAERRRIERNIHDGAQQQLVAIGVKAGLARTMVQRDPSKAMEILGQLREDAAAALKDLRNMTRGADPPLLADEGLEAALMAKTRSTPIPVSIDAHDVPRAPTAVEVAAFYCCSEAIQNAVKYARASAIRVSIRHRPDRLSVAIADDGIGFDPTTTRRGVGMRSMQERVASLGGSLDVRSAPGRGTTLRVTLPITIE
jgi:signal transduction histidine kinase